MSKFIKLPDKLNMWKINELLSSDNNCEIYKISTKDYDGTVVNALLRHISIYGDVYNDENVNYFEDEAAFINSVAKAGDCFNYIDTASTNEPIKEKYDFYIVTHDLKTLADIIKSKNFTDYEIIDFGIQMCSILELLEAKNIFHGNINPENIYVTSDGKYKLGGFSDCESKINNMSFVAPEIFRKENADFTTDIYSLGIIMYYMCNNYKIPFESSTGSKNDAVNERFSGKQVYAPEHGSEKLKSVIIIACQYNNANRWKNAGNIKNALTSIKNEFNDNLPENNPVIIPPASTNFGENVFEEYEYEATEFEDSLPEDSNELNESSVNESTQNNSENNKDNFLDNDNSSGFTFVDVTEVENTENENLNSFPQNHNKYTPISVDTDETLTNQDNEKTKVLPTVDNDDVFDEYAAGNKKNNLNKNSDEKDYGDYFEDEPVKSFVNIKNSDNDDNNLIEDIDYEGDEKRKGKRNIILISVTTVLVLAVLGVAVFFIINGMSNNSKQEPSSSSLSTSIETTAPNTTIATSAPVTTQPTTSVPKINVVPVVGYGYSYGKKLLEEQGFKVEISDYRYSTIYEEGYIIEQTPEGDNSADKGTVVKLVISSGLIEETTSAPQTQAPEPNENSSSNNSDSDFIFSNSDSVYLSYAQVDALSDSELQLAINEIYARRGRIFNDPGLSSYFNSKSWYEGKYTAEEFEKNIKFNTYEQKNLQLLIDERNTR